MTAREKFKIGDRVRLNETGLANRRATRSSTPTSGRVVGFCRVSSGVRVRRDGRSAVVAVHADWWEVAMPTGDAPLDELLSAAAAYEATITDDDRAEFTGQAVLDAALAFVRSLSPADRERLR